MLDLTEEYLRRAGPGNRKCVACDDEVRDPDDYLMIGYLADPESYPLGKFNYTHLHKSHISHWKQADEFLKCARTTLAEGKWQGPVLPQIIRQIEAGTLVNAR